MADVYATNATLALNTSPAELIVSNEWRGNVLVMNDSYEAAAAASGTDIIVGRLTSGNKVLSQSRILTDDLGTGVTLSLALRTTDDGTETELLPATDAATAAVIIAATIAEIGNFPAAVTEEVDVIVKVGGAAATGTIVSEIYYTNC